MKLGRWLFGFRDDVDLDQRWWHRLAKVTFVLLCVVVAVLVAIMNDRAPKPTGGNIRIVETLNDYAKGHKNVASLMPGFATGPGIVGTLNDDGSVTQQYALESYVFCSWDLSAHPEEELAFLNEHFASRYPNTTVEEVKKWMTEAGQIPTPACMDPDNVVPGQPASKIVRYGFTTQAQMSRWATTGLTTFLWAALVAFVTMNVYYRGLVFIICGPRKKKSETAVV
jgi:hypothetical protein